MKKSYQSFVDYMWKIYPNENQLSERTAMLKGYEFLSGLYDYEEKERNEISIQIGNKLKEKFG